MNSVTNGVFTDENENELLKDLNKFGDWLKNKNIIASKTSLVKSVDFPFSNSDWVMNVNLERKTVSFNTFMINATSLDFYRIVMIHEFFHLAVQGVPHKENVTKIKDTFGGELMKLIDIQADVFTALFLREVLNYDLHKYLSLLFEGRSAFNDSWIRPPKLERFIGSILSVGRVLLTHSQGDLREYHCYLPTISPLYTEKCLRLLIFKNEFMLYKDVEITLTEINDLKRCYGDNTEIDINEYLIILNSFVSKVLSLEVANNN